jgi:hypothetical protein
MRPAQSRHLRGVRRGFTLVEAIAAISVVAALGSVSSAVIFSGITSYRDGSVRAQLHAEESAAFDRISRALWSINRDSSVSVTAPLISSVTNTSISFNTNWSLSLSGTTLLLSENGGTANAIMNDVSAFTITAYDQSNAALTLPLSGTGTQPLRRIQIQVTGTRQGVSDSLRTRVFLRCTMAGAKVG